MTWWEGHFYEQLSAHISLFSWLYVYWPLAFLSSPMWLPNYSENSWPCPRGTAQLGRSVCLWVVSVALVLRASGAPVPRACAPYALGAP